MTLEGQHEDNADARRLLYFDLASDISRASTIESLKHNCAAATAALGYDFYLFGGYYPITENIVMSSSFPDDWRQRYDANGYIAHDPTVKHCWQNSSPIVWQELTYSDGELGELERKVMDEASDYGLKSGISLPVHGSGAEGCMLSLASREQLADYTYHDQAGLQIIVHAMHEAMKTVISVNAQGGNSDGENLSTREVECLRWTAKGKTAWEISRILELTESTVVFHMRKAIKKLEVTNRSQAVAKAMSLSKITPF